MQPIAIEIQDLTVRFGSTIALQSVSLSIPAGDVVSLSGSNGAGKTTLLRCMATLLGPSKGSITFFGQPITRNRTETRKQIAALLHPLPLFRELSVAEHFAFYQGLSQINSTHGNDIIERTGMRDEWSSWAGNLSTGYKQRLALAITLMQNSKLLLLDEPFMGLDAQVQQIYEELLTEYVARGNTLVFASHKHDPLPKLSARNVTLQKGALADSHE